MWYVYILQCRDGSFYTGCTNDLDQRLKNHFNGKGGRYTRSHKVQKLLYREQLSGKSEALKREAELKKYSRKKKEELIFSSLKRTVS